MNATVQLACQLALQVGCESAVACNLGLESDRVGGDGPDVITEAVCGVIVELLKSTHELLSPFSNAQRYTIINDLCIN